MHELGGRVLTASKDGAVAISSLECGAGGAAGDGLRLVQRYEDLHEGSVVKCARWRDADTFASCGNDRQLRVVDVRQPPTAGKQRLRALACGFVWWAWECALMYRAGEKRPLSCARCTPGPPVTLQARRWPWAPTAAPSTAFGGTPRTPTCCSPPRTTPQSCCTTCAAPASLCTASWAMHRRPGGRQGQRGLLCAMGHACHASLEQAGPHRLLPPWAPLSIRRIGAIYQPAFVAGGDAVAASCERSTLLSCYSVRTGACISRGDVGVALVATFCGGGRGDPLLCTAARTVYVFQPTWHTSLTQLHL